MRLSEHRTAQVASTLFNQQLWCWGQDVKCDTGNLLVRYGFERIPNAADPDISSLYRLTTTRDTRVVLRGFGAFYGNTGGTGLFVRRYGFRPMLVSAADAQTPLWTADHIPPLRWPTDDEVGCWWRLTLDLIDWIRDYESWIASELGTAYREKTLQPWALKKPLAANAESMASTWRWIGLRFAACPWGTVIENGSPNFTEPLAIGPEVLH